LTNACRPMGEAPDVRFCSGGCRSPRWLTFAVRRCLAFLGRRWDTAGPHPVGPLKSAGRCGGGTRGGERAIAWTERARPGVSGWRAIDGLWVGGRLGRVCSHLLLPALITCAWRDARRGAVGVWVFTSLFMALRGRGAPCRACGCRVLESNRRRVAAQAGIGAASGASGRAVGGCAIGKPGRPHTCSARR